MANGAVAIAEINAKNSTGKFGCLEFVFVSEYLNQEATLVIGANCEGGEPFTEALIPTGASAYANVISHGDTLIFQDAVIEGPRDENFVYVFFTATTGIYTTSGYGDSPMYEVGDSLSGTAYKNDMPFYWSPGTKLCGIDYDNVSFEGDQTYTYWRPLLCNDLAIP